MALRLDPNKFVESIRILLKNNAPNEDFHAFYERVLDSNEIEKANNLAATLLSNNDVTTGIKSQVQALGSGNPFTIKTTGNTVSSVTVQGAEAIAQKLSSIDLPGREYQTYIVGSGVTAKGTKKLAKMLACMTIGDLDALLHLKNIDPAKVTELLKDIQDLAKALYSEFISKLFSEAASILTSFDVLLKGDFSFPRQQGKLFAVSIPIPVAGLLIIDFSFGMDYYYGVQFAVGAKIMEMKAIVEVEPYGGVIVWGELGVGYAALYGKLRLVGHVMDSGFPTTAEITFNKFPLDVKLQMFLRLTPIKLRLYAVVTLEVKLGFIPTPLILTLYKAKLWEYQTATIRKLLIDNTKAEEDESPPKLQSYGGTTPAGSCGISQVTGRDHTEPEFIVSIQAEDDRSNVNLHLDIGTVPGGSNVMSRRQLGGFSTAMNDVLHPAGVPLYFTVHVSNEAGVSVPATCKLDTFDVTIPGGRMAEAFVSTSNPNVLKAVVTVYEDSPIKKTMVAVGYGKNTWAEQIIRWTPTTVAANIVDYDVGHDPLNLKVITLFASGKAGRLVGRGISVGDFYQITTKEECAAKCNGLHATKCLSFNYDFGSSGHCELLEAIEGHDHKISRQGHYMHYEKLGVGSNRGFQYNNLQLPHDHIMYFNFRIVNSLGFENILSSKPILTDYTPPDPTSWQINITSDRLETIKCLDVIPDDRDDWEERFCEGVNPKTKNHRIVIDGEGSETVYNGHTYKNDLTYTRANRYISANWDGIYDNETGILGYSVTAGESICEEKIKQHHDPHAHLFDRSQWTHTVMMTPLEEPYTILPDGPYYITVRAINNIQYGGALSTSICHSSPYIVDNSPPLVYEVYNVRYDEHKFNLSLSHNSSDPNSGVIRNDLCLGKSTRDCDELMWVPMEYNQNMTYLKKITEGVPIWVKVTVVNNVDLRTIGRCDSPLIVDNSPPVAGTVNDGEIYGVDLDFTRYEDKICSNWQSFYDPQSGIAMYMVGVGSSPNQTDVANLTRFSSKSHVACVELKPDKYLSHNQKYFTTVYAYNGGHKQQNVSAISNGVLVDLTKPVPGQIVDGNSVNFTDMKYTTSQAKVDLQWKSFFDPESNISHYDVKVYRAGNLSQDYEEIRDWTKFDASTSSVKWLNFHNYHKDIIKTSLRTTNRALNEIVNTTDGFIVDLTPPQLHYLWDGDQEKDREFQSDISQLTASFKYTDKESGVDHIKLEIFEMFHGTRTQKYPEIHNEWMELPNGDMTSYTWTGLSLRNGARYTMRVGAINHAGFLASFETNGVVIDITPPIVLWLKIGVSGDAKEQQIDGHVWQADRKGVQATWLCKDPESGITEYEVAVGTSPGGTDKLLWKSVGTDSSPYINGLNLELTNQTTRSPVYYLSVRARNGAGVVNSSPKISTPIIVVEEDKAGIVVDGPNNVDRTVVERQAVNVTSDIDYQLGSSTVSVQFAGFESALHGVMRFEVAVGTQPSGDDVLPFTSANIVHNEEDDIAGHGLSSSGFVTMNLPLKANKTYFSTIRGVTNEGNVLETSSDGFTVDQTPPVIGIDRLGDKSATEVDVSEGVLIYEQTVDALSAMWHYNDTESQIVRAWYSVGTYPYGQDIASRKKVTITSTLSSFLANNEVTPDITGKPNIISVWAENSVGLVSKSRTGTVVIDKTAPTAGTVSCPAFIQASVPVVCTWTGFLDTESPIKEYRIMMGNSKGDNSLFSGGLVPGFMQTFTIQGIGHKMEHGAKYYVTVTAVNSVDMTENAFSDAIGVDLTPPQKGMVVDLSSVYRIDVTSSDNTVAMNAKICLTEDECKTLDAVCTESLTSLSLTWIPFKDPESDITEYQVAVGTTPGGGQVKAFYKIPADSKHHTVTGLNLDGYRQLFVSVKGINGAGLSSVSTSDGVYISYLSQRKPPLSPIGVFDMTDGEDVDVDFQTDINTMQAGWDMSGDPCPAVKYEWAIRRIDGLEVSSFLDMGVKTRGLNDGLVMKNLETYINLVRVTNAIGYEYTMRSNGVTVQETPILPGKVFDGDINGYDLNYQPTKSTVSANWNGFGLPADAISQINIKSGNPGIQIDKNKLEEQDGSQQVAYYLVALGTDRRFNHTRDDVVPYTNVGTNTSVTFYDLDLTAGIAVYYFSVYAISKSFSRTLVTSNGFYVGYDGGVTVGSILMPGPCVSQSSELEVQYEKFTSKLGILMHYIAISNHTEANFTNCKQYIDGGNLPEQERKSLFSVLDVTNMGHDTYTNISGLQMEQGKTYYVWVMGTDKSGACEMTFSKFLVDVTPPEVGRLRIGPWYDMKMAYTTDNSSINVTWEGFEDFQSGISTFEVSLWKNKTCQKNSEIVLVTDWITLSRNYSFYQLVDQQLEKNVPYFVKLRVINCAGLSVVIESPPVFVDFTLPSPGVVKNGINFQSDRLWFYDPTFCQGTFLHFANPYFLQHTCPDQEISMRDNTEWRHLNKLGMLDPDGEAWRIKYEDKYVIPAPVEDIVDIKLVLTKDSTNRDIMGAGAIYRRAELYNGGTYKIRLQAAGRDGEAVTEILFWDGPEEGIATYKYQPEAEFVNCDCCFVDPLPQWCSGCNCTSYLMNQGFYLNETFTTTPAPTTTTPENVTFSPYDVVDKQGSSVIYKPGVTTSTAEDSCGVQIYSANLKTNTSAFIVFWCRYFNDTSRMRNLVTEIDVDPSDGFHNYKVEFAVKNEEATSTVICMMVYMDDDFLNEICDVPHLSTEALLFLHVFKRLNQLPEHSDKFSVWSARASVSSLVMPPPVGTLCRSGQQFVSFTNPIMKYEAGVGTTSMTDDAAAFRKIEHPCIPCIDECSRYACDESCEIAETVLKTFTLSNLTLPSKKIIVNDTGHEIQQIVTYYFTVRGVTGSGDTAVASSNGFYIDDSPPVFDQEVMSAIFYYDVGQGEYTPVKFQKSNDTIKCIWKCDDKESDIMENFWAIGTSPGATDIQNYTSTGQSIIGINKRLGGILEHNKTYYASFICSNGAGLNTTYIDTGGVIVKLIPPDVDSVNNTIPGTSHFLEEVYPKDSLQQQDPNSVGFTFTKSEDPSVNRYDLCVGSEEETDDIIPCTWVGYNMSGSAEIKDGALWINGVEIRKLSDLKPYQDYTNTNSSASNGFNMPVGQQMFVTMRLCNKAMLCTNKSLGVVVITNSDSVLATSTNGSAIEEKLSITSRKRAAAKLDIQTPSGLADGQAIVVTKLSESDLTKDYRSDASIDYVPYIKNPETSKDMVERLLYKRIFGQNFAFSIVPLGNVPMPGPVAITYPDSVGHVTTGNRTMLLHWNPVMQYWEISSRTCKHLPPEEQEVYYPDKQTMSVKVCNTHTEGKINEIKTRRRRAVTLTDYYEKETMFILSLTSASIYNSAPVLDSQTQVNIMEDSGTLHYQLSAVDEEGDSVIFSLLNKTQRGEVSLSSDGFLVYTPCLDCFGDEEINILLKENQSNTDIPPASSQVTINVHIQPINDPPVVFLTQNGLFLGNDDITEDTVILLEAINDLNFNANGLWKARIGAYDVEKSDILNIVMSNPSNLNFTLIEESRQVPQLLKDCNSYDRILPTMMPCSDNFTQNLPHPALEMSWLTYIIEFTQPKNVFGNFTVSLYFEDSSNQTSLPINIKFGIMEMPCHNNGKCKATGIYPCEDTHRTHSFDAYYRCVCRGGYQGKYCTEDVNECLSDPCVPPFVCYNDMDSYRCVCPSDNPNCEFEVWMIFVIVLMVIIILVLIIIAIYRYRTKRGKVYFLKKRASEKSISSFVTGSHDKNSTSNTDNFETDDGIQNFFTYAERDDVSHEKNDIDKYSTSDEDEFFVHPPPNTNWDENWENENNCAQEEDENVSSVPPLEVDTQDFYEKIAKALATHKKDESFIHPPPAATRFPQCIEMQSKPIYGQTSKTLAANVHNQEQFFLADRKENTRPNREEKLEPTETETGPAEVSGGQTNRGYVDENFTTPFNSSIDTPTKTTTMSDENECCLSTVASNTSLGSPSPTDDLGKCDDDPPIDSPRFTTRLAWSLSEEEETCEEQSTF